MNKIVAKSKNDLIPAKEENRPQEEDMAESNGQVIQNSKVLNSEMMPKTLGQFIGKWEQENCRLNSEEYLKEFGRGFLYQILRTKYIC